VGHEKVKFPESQTSGFVRNKSWWWTDGTRLDIHRGEGNVDADCTAAEDKTPSPARVLCNLMPPPFLLKLFTRLPMLVLALVLLRRKRISGFRRQSLFVRRREWLQSLGSGSERGQGRPHAFLVLLASSHDSSHKHYQHISEAAAEVTGDAYGRKFPQYSPSLEHSSP
jgi:hypothetical protein